MHYISTRRSRRSANVWALYMLIDRLSTERPSPFGPSANIQSNTCIHILLCDSLLQAMERPWLRTHRIPPGRIGKGNHTHCAATKKEKKEMLPTPPFQNHQAGVCRTNSSPHRHPPLSRPIFYYSLRKVGALDRCVSVYESTAKRR